MMNGQSEDEYVTLGYYASVVSSQWRMVVIATVSAMILAVIYASLATRKYEVEIIVSPSLDAGTQLLPNGIGQAGNIAGMLGLIGNSDSSSVEAILTLQSRGFIFDFIERHSLMPVLFAHRYIIETNEWKESTFSRAPSLTDGYELFVGEVLSVSEDKSSGTWRISILWSDPEIAYQWLNLIVADVNEIRRKRDLENATNAIAFLESRLSTTTNLAVRESMYSVIESHLRVQTMANVQKEYALRTIGRAVIPGRENFKYPNRKLTIILGLLAGLSLSVMASFLRVGRVKEGGKVG